LPVCRVAGLLADENYRRMKQILIASFIATSAYAFGQTDYKVIITKTQREVIPEGITVNPVDGKIYVSSIALQKIIAIDTNGAHKDFIKTGQNGFLEGLGMKIDAKKQWLWVVANQKQSQWYKSQVHAFDLKTGSVKQRYEIQDTVRHLFNDLILHSNGQVYITDTYGSSIYKVDPVKQELKLFIQDSLLLHANGITCNEKGRIYVASSHGLLQLDVASKKISPLTYKDFKKALWMDGLVYWNNSIIGVADSTIMQYHLNREGNQIVSERIIDEANHHFQEPTTAVVFSNKLYVLANSHLAAYNKNKESVKGIENELSPVVIVVYPLAIAD
jgi:streptogramin lyase